MPGAEDAIRAAVNDGWVAVLFVCIVIGGFSTLGVIIRQMWIAQREATVFQQTTLVKLVSETNIALANFTNAVHLLQTTVEELRRRKCPMGNGNEIRC